MEDADADELDALAVRRVALEGPLHVPPVPELEGDLGRAAVDLKHLASMANPRGKAVRNVAMAESGLSWSGSKMRCSGGSLVRRKLL